MKILQISIKKTVLKKSYDNKKPCSKMEQGFCASASAKAACTFIDSCESLWLIKR